MKMRLWHIALWVEGSFYSGIDDDFQKKFSLNSSFVNDYLSKQVRKTGLQADDVNMISVTLNAKVSGDSAKVDLDDKILSVTLKVTREELDAYTRMDEQDKYEFYLRMLERGYQRANSVRPFDISVLCALHDRFRENGYRNEWNFKKKAIREYGISISLDCRFTSFDFQLNLSVYDMRKNLMGKGCIYRTYPEPIFFHKTVRHLVISDGKLIVADFLKEPQFECSLEQLSKGIVESRCLDEDTMKYMYSEQTKAEFEKLR